MTESVQADASISERSTSHSEQRGGCDSTFFTAQHQAILEIRRAMQESDDPRVSIDV